MSFSICFEKMLLNIRLCLQRHMLSCWLFFFFPSPNGVYLPAVLVFEVLIPDKRPPLLRDGVRQRRRGMYRM